MKMNYEAPVAEVISFTSMEQLASSLDVTLGELDGGITLTSREF